MGSLTVLTYCESSSLIGSLTILTYCESSSLIGSLTVLTYCESSSLIGSLTLLTYCESESLIGSLTVITYCESESLIGSLTVITYCESESCVTSNRCQNCYQFYYCAILKVNASGRGHEDVIGMALMWASTSHVCSGLSDVPGESMVKNYCPRCLDVYVPKSTRHHHTDGAYFGTGFPHMLFMVHPEYRPKRPANQFVPR